MAEATLEVKKIDILMEEYRQLYEHARHDDNIASQKESIFAIAAFSILAYTISRQLSFWQMFSAGLASVTIWIYHIFSCERMAFYYFVRYKRIQEIEKTVNNEVGCKVVCFQTEHDKYKRMVNLERQANKRWFKLLNPYFWILKSVGYIGIRPMRMAMTLVLILLWVVAILNRQIVTQ